MWGERKKRMVGEGRIKWKTELRRMKFVTKWL
jgi:hypothetical protein